MVCLLINKDICNCSVLSTGITTLDVVLEGYKTPSKAERKRNSYLSYAPTGSLLYTKLNLSALFLDFSSKLFIN